MFDGVSCRFGALAALSVVRFDVGDGKIVGLLGPNGAGKSTLLNCATGVIQTYTGEIKLGERSLSGLPIWRRARLGISRTFQTPRLLGRETVWDNLAVGGERIGSPWFWAEALNTRSARRARADLADRTARVCRLLGLDDVIRHPVGELPFARRRVVELGRALVGEPTALLCDEPAAGLESRERASLAAILQEVNESLALTMVIVEHDVGFMARLAHQVVMMDFGQVIAVGDLDAVLADEQVRRSYFGTSA